ncbi:S8 family serine peptidase [archaeon]|jgi:thermitase|nr:S8 family serine peptidase [archaeon]
MRFGEKCFVVVFIFVSLIFIIPFLVSESVDEKISIEVLKEFSELGEKNYGNVGEDDEKVKVVIKLKDVSEDELEEILEEEVLEDVEEDEVYKNYISTEVSFEELEVLEENKDVEMVSENHVLSAFLQDVGGIVNFTIVNPLKVSGLNLTGVSKTVCVIDSGVDFTHPDLAGKNDSCVIDCFNNKACVENCSAGDENGHGTHVAGIVGASGGIFGVASNVSLIGVKILDENGDGSGWDVDLTRAIDYCVAQNVEVITMSLGTATLYDSDCAGSMGGWTDSVDAAFANNISIIASSGNAGNWTHIASPACIGNVTPVGGTNKNDAIFYNRNSLVDLVAPGVSINSTYNNGAYLVQGGTSMATPVVAGAYAIIYQLLDLTGRIMNNFEIEEVLNNTGKTINDASSGLSFTRIDIYEAVLSLDNISPNVTLNSPVDGNVSLIGDFNFSCNYSDWQLSNVSFYLWNSSGLFYNESKDVSGISNSSVFNYSFSVEDDYSWNCFVYDDKSNLGFADSNFSFSIANVVTILDSPENNSYVNQAVNFSCNLTSAGSYILSNASFYLWNSSGLYYNESKDVSGISNSSVFNYSFSVEDDYSWNCLGFNNNSESDWGNNNFSVGYDVSDVNVSLNGPSDGVSYSSNSQSVVFYYNVSDNNEVANCSLVVGGVVSSSNLTIDKSSSNLTFVQSFVPGTYNWNINCSDDAGNVGNSSSRSFTVIAVASPSVSSSGGGGGGGGSSTKTYVLTSVESSEVNIKKLNKNDKIKFAFFDEVAGEHILTVTKINSDSVELVVRSDVINLKLGIGQSIKLNLTSPDYYDLYLKLNSIVDGKVELVIQTINEKILSHDISIGGKSVDDSVLEEDVSDGADSLVYEIGKLRYVIFILIVIIVVFIVSLLFPKKEVTKHKFGSNKRESFLKHLLEI